MLDIGHFLYFTLQYKELFYDIFIILCISADKITSATYFE